MTALGCALIGLAFLMFIAIVATDHLF